MAEIRDLNIIDDANVARWPEGQAPSSVNDGARAGEGFSARGYKDTIDTTLVSTGSANAYLLTTNRNPPDAGPALYSGFTATFQANHANDDAATLAVTLNTTVQPAKAIVNIRGEALTGGEIPLDGMVTVIFRETGDHFMLVSPSGVAALTAADIGVTVQPYNAATLFSDATANLTAGFTANVVDKGEITTGTLTPVFAEGNFQKYVNGGAHTLAPPATGSGSLVLQMTNNASAGAVTTSGFTKVSGDQISTTNGASFLFFITVLETTSHLQVQSL